MDILYYNPKHISSVWYGPTLGKLLGRVILWLAYSENAGFLPDEMVERIKASYEDRRTIPDEQNPIKQVEQHVSGRNAQVFIDVQSAAEEEDILMRAFSMQF